MPRGEPFFVDKYGKVCSADRDYRVVLVDGLGWTLEEVEAADSQSPWFTSPADNGYADLHPHDGTWAEARSHREPGAPNPVLVSNTPPQTIGKFSSA